MATKYPKTARTGKKGVDFVSQVANECGSIFRSFETADVGLDGAIEFVDANDEPSGDMILVQIKSGSSHVKGGQFTIQADRDHFETWVRYSVPIVGIVYDPDTDKARWVDISDHLRRYPERIAEGPYAIALPPNQDFSSASFGVLAKLFVRSRTTSTHVDVTPNFLIREWKPKDSKPTRALLTSIASDYPQFDDWLNKQWGKHSVSKKVVDVGQAVAAYSMWVKKDDRNVKLQTFIVGQIFRGTAVGQHLLYHELRTWAADPKIERVFVTVASSKVDLIHYFEQFGFRVEGISANRYPRSTNAAELVLAKHFRRDIVREPQDVERVIGEIAQCVWGVDATAKTSTRFGVSGKDFSVPTQFSEVRVDANYKDATVPSRVALLSRTGKVLRTHDDASLMREFYPLRIHLQNKLYAIVPIYSKWVKAMLNAGSASGTLPTNLKLRVDNVYYCYPKLSRLSAGDLVIFYEPAQGGGLRSAIGCAVIKKATLGTPEALFAQYSDLGVYKLEDIQKHAKSAPRGKAMAIHFELFEPFTKRITLDEIRATLGNQTNIQGLTKITRDQFEHLRQRGLS